VGLFITGTDTGVGKTHTLTQLLRLLRGSGVNCTAMNPICCGDRRDAELLLAASSEGLTLDEVNPVSLKTPVAPLAAALAEKVDIDIDAVLNAFAQLQERVDQVFVEGVGGWLVPIRPDYFVADLAVDMKLPVLVVAQNRLGCLNHVALTVQSVVDRGLSCAGVVLNDPLSLNDPATRTNRDILGTIINAPILPGLTENTKHFESDWVRMLDVTLGLKCSQLDTSVNKIDTERRQSDRLP
jgi:dethiobiotin synthetase